VLADKSNPGNEDFSQLAMAPADSNFKGVSFAPTSFGVITVPEASTWAMMLIGFAGLGFGAFRRAKTAVRVPFGNELVLLDRSKGRLATDADGRVIGAEPRRSHDDDEQTC
jgi:PEP-CTERM motif